MALDTESDSLYHHFEKVCLVQIATDRGQAVLVDALAVRDLSPLAPAMANPGLVKVLHGADYDVTTLKRDFGFSFASLFDTMIAARFLGRSEIGLAAVARDELGVALTKDNQKDDWSRRPLTPQQETYALADVLHLVELRERLSEKLAAAGRLGWLEEECEAVARLEPAARKRDPEAYLGVKGAQRLPPRALAALRELHAWRERRAEEKDTPPFKILGNESLLRLAELRPKDAAGLGAVPGILPRLQRQAGDLLGAVRRAEDLPESELPKVARLASTRGRGRRAPAGRSAQGLSRAQGSGAAAGHLGRPAPAPHRPPGRGPPPRRGGAGPGGGAEALAGGGIRRGVAGRRIIDPLEIRQVRDPGRPRPGRDGQGVPGTRPDTRPSRCAQDRLARAAHGQGHPRPVPARGAGRRPAAAPEHRHDLRARRGRGHALHRHGARRGDGPRRGHGPAGPLHPRAEGPHGGGRLPGPRLRAQDGGHPPRREAGQHPADPGRDGQDPRLRHRPLPRLGDDRPEPDPGGNGAGDAELPLPRARAGGEGGPPRRHVGGGGDPVRDARRGAGLSRRPPSRASSTGS